MKKERMNSKDRVMCVFAGGIPDRIPIDFTTNPGILALLRKHFGKADILDDLNVDFRHVGAPYIGPMLHEKIPGMDVDPVTGMRSRWIEHQSGGYHEICDYPLKDADEEQAAAWPVPSADDFDYTKIQDACKKYGRYAVSIGGPPDIINNTGRLRTMEQVLIDLVTDDPAGLMIIDKRTGYELEVLYRTLEASKGGIDFLFLGEDLGTQRGAVMSPELFRKHIKPRLKKFADLGRHFGIPVMIHSCGSSSWAFDDLIQIGISAVDTLQPEAKDMDPLYLKKTYGGRLAFHGCISTAGPLAYGTADEVRKYVKDIIGIMKPGGGYMLAPTHQIQDNSPLENVLAMYETAYEEAWYE